MNTNLISSKVHKVSSIQLISATYDKYVSDSPEDELLESFSNGSTIHVCSSTSVTSEQITTSKPDRNPAVWINTKTNKSTRAEITEIDNQTRGLEQVPEVLLPQEMIANIHPLQTVDSDTVVIQIWEGCVQELLLAEGKIKAALTAKIGNIPDHVVTIDLQWVPRQDTDLIMLGAIFYLTLFKRVKKGGTIENSQEIRFRRRPNWSKSQIARISERASEMQSKFRTKPLAE